MLYFLSAYSVVSHDKNLLEDSREHDLLRLLEPLGRVLGRLLQVLRDHRDHHEEEAESEEDPHKVVDLVHHPP